MSRERSFLAPAAAAIGGAVVLLSAPAAADPVIEAIYTKIPGHPTAAVPGAKDPDGEPFDTEFRMFDELWVSPTGKWNLRARTQQVVGEVGYNMSNVFLLGEGNVGNVVLQRMLPFPGAVGDEAVDFFGGGGPYNDNGDFAFRLRAMGGSTATFQKVMRVINGNMEVAFVGGNAPGGDPYTGLEGPAGTPQTGNAGNSIGSTHLLNDGMIGTHDGGVHGMDPSTLYRPVLAYDLQKFMQRNVDTVTGLGGVGTELIGGTTGFSSDRFFATPDFDPFGGSGSGSWIAVGQIAQPSDQNVVIVNHEVVMRQNHALPNDPSTVPTVASPATTPAIAPNGDWYVRTGEVGGGALAIRNGVAIARAGDEVEPGSGEHWAGTAFSVFRGNTNGDWLLAGQTDNPDASKNFVIVVNGEVVVREGDPVQVSGGVPVFVGRSNQNSPWSANDVFLTDDKVLYFVASINDGAGNDYAGDPAFSSPLAFLRIDLGDPGVPCPGDLTGNGSVGVPDLLELLSCWGPVQPGCEAADLTGSGSVGVPDLLELLAQWGPCP